MILHECFHRLIAGQSEGIITPGRLTIPVFGTLPEQAFVVTQERRTLHLALMPEDGIPLLTQFLWTHRHAHLDVGHIPFRPGTAIHPYSAVLQPLGTGFFLLVNGCEYGIRTLTMGAMRIGEVGSDIDLVGLYLLQQLHDWFDIALCHRQFLDLAALIERQVEEVDVILGDMVIAAGITGLASTDQSFHGEDGLIVPIPLFLLLQVTHDFTIADLDDLVGAVGKEFVEAVDEVHIEAHFLIRHSDIARCLVGHMHVVTMTRLG